MFTFLYNNEIISSDPYLYFEIVPHSENNLWNVGGQFGLMPERKTFDFFMSHKQVIEGTESVFYMVKFTELISYYI